MINHQLKKVKVRSKCPTGNQKVGRINMLSKKIPRNQLEVSSKRKRGVSQKMFTKKISMKMLQKRMKPAAAGANAA